MWCASVDLGIVNGKRRRKMVYGQTRKEVAEKLKTLQRDRAAGVTFTSMTVKEYLDQWLEQTVKRKNRVRTYDRYAADVHNYLVPELGKYQLAKLTPAHVQTMLNKLADAGLAHRSIRNVRAALRRALNQAMHFGYVVKTEASMRTMALPPSLLMMLREHQQHQADMRDCAHRWTETGLVFTSSVGTPIEPSDLSRHFKEVLGAAGLPGRTRFHDLRHSCATLLIVMGVHPRVIMEILGHSQISTTMNIYAHVLPRVQREAVTGLDALFAEPNAVEVASPSSNDEELDQVETKPVDDEGAEQIADV